MKKIDIPACEMCQSRTQSVFSELGDAELKMLSENKCGNLYKKGQVLFYEGNKPTGLFCVNKGKIKTYRLSEDGSEQILRLGKEGDVLGYASMITGDNYTCGASVIEDALICYIPKNVFIRVLDTNQEFSKKLIRLLAHDVKRADDRIVQLAQHNVRERLAETLLMVKEFGGVEQDGVTLKTLLSREEIANIVGTATETVIRLLADFKNDNLIELDGKRILIRDGKSLREIANIQD